MLDLPERGDVIARRYVIAGLIGYVMLAGVFVGSLIYAARPRERLDAALELLGWGKHANWPLALLVFSGIALTFFTIWRVYKDFTHLRREEDDVDWVKKNERKALLLVFANPGARAQLLANKEYAMPDSGTAVETLVDDRVRRVHSAAISGGTVATNELQSIAEIRTARYGSFARYASSLLLLFAVLGTFAGVKTALPGLIDAVTGAAGAISPMALSGPLGAVAGAFGGNALALIGAIAVGLMAQGFGIGRRHLLERIELVSVEYIYGESTSSDANPLQAAVTALRDTAQQFHASSGVMTGIEAGLQNLSSEFRTAFETLAERLSDIASQQQEGLYDKNADAMKALQSSVGDMAKQIEANALAHGVLVTSVKERAHESKVAIDYMREASERLGGTLSGVLALTERADTSLKDLRTASAVLVQGSEGVLLTTRALETSASAIRPAIDSLVHDLGESANAVKRMADESRAAWEATATKVVARLQEAPRGVAVPSTGDPGTGEMLTVLRRIAAALTQNIVPTRPSIVAAALPSLTGTLIGGGIMYVLLKLL